MVLGVMEGQIRGGYFPDYIFDPSVVDCSAQGCCDVQKESNLKAPVLHGVYQLSTDGGIAQCTVQFQLGLL